MDDDQTKEMYHEAMRDKQLLVRKTRKMGTEGESSSDSDSDSSMSADEMKRKAVAKINEEMEGSGSDDQSESSENEGEFKMDFGERQDGSAKNKDTGITALKFMQRAEQRKKEALKKQVEVSMGQIRKKDDYDDAESDGDNILNAKKKFGAKGLQIEE